MKFNLTLFLLIILFSHSCHAGKTFVVPENYLYQEAVRGDRSTSFPYISGDTFRAFCNFVIDEKRIPFDPTTVQYGDTIFLNLDYGDYFFKHIHPYIDSPYILVTHNSDLPCPGSFREYLDDAKILAWFGQNRSIKEHPKLYTLPIGLANRYWPYGDVDLLDKMSKRISSDIKNIILYINFSFSTNPERKPIHDMFVNQWYCTVAGRRSYGEYLNDLAQAQFILSPEGTGIDCYRTWEALLMGAIPVVKHSTIDDLFEGLPVVLVDDWSEVTYDFLQEKYAKLLSMNFDAQKLFVPFWFEKIKKVQQDLRSNRYGAKK